MHTRCRRLPENIFDYNVCCRLLGLVVLLDAVAAEGMSVEEHGEDDDDDDEEEEREDDDGDVGHDLDAAVAHLHHLQPVVVVAMAGMAAARGVAQGLLDVQRVLEYRVNHQVKTNLPLT